MSARQPSKITITSQPIVCDARTAGTVAPSTGVDCRGFEWLKATLLVGDIASTGTIVMKLQESSASDGTGDAFADITGATTATIGDTGDNLPYSIELYLQPRERYVRPSVTLANAGADYSVIFELFHPEDSTLATDTVVTKV